MLYLAPSPVLHLPLTPSPKQLHRHRHSRATPHLSSSPPHLTNRFPTSPTTTTSTRFCNSAHSSDAYEVELDRLLALLPDDDARLRGKVREHSEFSQLIEVVMDLGRKPLARFPSGDFPLSDRNITRQDLDCAASKVGDFAIDNRAGISRTLHRISAIRNRKGAIVGLTCRVGRAIPGSANLLKDLLDGSSLLLIGPPGVGKTTIIREIARIIADDYKKRVMIVDTSNEIGGDGDIPHPGIGNARRMQVPITDMQHKVMIEAVENHMPEVIVIDEIGTKLEAIAASTIAQRGIQLVATAHGVTIENLIMNPSLQMLVGGIQSVTLGDEEASRRGGQKTVQERKGPPTFTCGVEIISKTELRLHRSLEVTVDAILSGRPPLYEIRKLNSDRSAYETLALQNEPLDDMSSGKKDAFMVEDLGFNSERVTTDKFITESSSDSFEKSSKCEASLRVYVYGILETTVIKSIRELKVDDVVEITDNISEANALLALNSKLKKNTRIQAVAKSHDIPVYVIKMSSMVQISKAMRALINDHVDGKSHIDAEDAISSPERMDAIEEARLAIEQVVIPKAEPVELLPRPFSIMCLQMDLIRKHRLQWEKVGEEPSVRLRILPFEVRIDEDKQFSGMVDTDSIVDDSELSNDLNGFVYKVDRLPLLPD